MPPAASPHRSHEPQPGVYASLPDLIRLQHKARGFSFLPRQPVHSLLTGRYASRLRGRGLDFEEIRGYLPGDDIRNIDWKATARTRRPMTRVYTEERDRPALYVVDQRLAMFFGSRRNMKSVTAAELAALGAWRSLSVGDRPGALVFDDREIREVRPHRSRKRVMQILGAVLQKNHALDPDRGGSSPGMLNQVLERVLQISSHDWLVCLIGDFDGADDETRRLLTRLARHNDVLAALVYDPLETQLPEAGRLVVSDGELQLEFDSGDARLRRRFSEVFSQRLARAREVLLKRDIPVLPVHTAEGAAEQVRRLLGYSPRARRG